ETKQGDGEVWLELSKSHYRYQTRFKLKSGECTLWRKGKDKTEQLGEAKTTRLKGPGSYQVRFANIDARLTVWVDNELPFGDGFEYAPPEVCNWKDEKERKLTAEELAQRRGPTGNDLEPASIGAMEAKVQIQQVRLWRDTYYTTSGNKGDIEPDQWASETT